MNCIIADLLVKVPAPDCLKVWCRKYEVDLLEDVQITIEEQKFDFSRYTEMTQHDSVVYQESATQFYRELLQFSGMYVHASAVALDNHAYLFSGPCGMGKSTHTRLWQQVFGEAAQIINDDKPALRRLDGQWFAYGTPWCGKDHINVNRKVPLQGICFLKRGEENRIRRLAPLEATAAILTQTMRKFKQVEYLDLLLSHVDKLVREIPIYELECLPNEEAALLSYNTMRPRD